VERLDLPSALDQRTAQAEVERVVSVAVEAVRRGVSVVVYSAEGPDDPAVTGFDTIALSAGLARHVAARQVGRALADVMCQLLDRAELSRVVVAGGDSSGEVASALGITALSVVAGLAPGAPLCRVWSDLPQRDGLEIVLKGGQIGDAGFFGSARGGARRK
jgi:3-oxoisoapionate kinase